MRVTFEPESRPAEPLEEQRLVLLEDRELRVLADARLHPLHGRHRGLAQPQRVRRARRELPQPHADADAPVVVALEQAGVDELADDPVRRRARQARAAADLGGGLHGARGGEGLEHAHEPVGDRVAGGRSSPCVTAMTRLPLNGNARARGSRTADDGGAPNDRMSKETPMTSVESDRADQEAFSSSVVLEQTAAAPESLLASPDQLSQAEITQEILDLHAAHDAPRGRRRVASATTLHDFPPYRSSILRHPTKNPKLVDPETIELLVAGVRAARCRRDRVGPDAAARRRAAGRADDGAGPPARLVGPPAREPADRALAGQRRRALHPPARPAPRARSTRTSPAPAARSRTTTASTSSRRSSPAPTRGRTT